MSRESGVLLSPAPTPESTMPPADGVLLILVLAAFAAGVMNSIAGGGTLLTFPALLTVLAPEFANATSTVAVLPGSIAGAVGYRQELWAARRFAVQMLPVSLLGGTVGAILLVWYPAEFGALVPWLIFLAAFLFLIQPPLNKLLKRQQTDFTHRPGPGLLAGLMAFQFGVAVYGGYFGAGIGILMLSALGFMGIGDINKANGVKTFLASAINAVSVVIFVQADLVNWPYALVMAASAIVGGFAGAKLAKRMPARYVRWLVVAIGFGLALFYALK